MSADLLFDNEWHFLLHNDGYLHFNWLHLSLMDFHSLIFDSISVCFNWHFPDDFIRYSLFNFNLNWFFLVDFYFNNFFNLDKLDLLFPDDNLLFDNNFNRNFDSLNDDFRHRNLNNLQLLLSNHNNLLNNSWNLNNPVDDPRNHNDLLHYFLDFDNSRHFHDFLNNDLDYFRLHPDNFNLFHNWHWFLDYNLLDDLLTSGNDFGFFNFEFLHFLLDVRDGHLNNNRNFFFDVEWYYFLNLDIASHHNFLNYWLINEDLHLSDKFFFVSFDEMGPIDVNLFGYFFD